MIEDVDRSFSAPLGPATIYGTLRDTGSGPLVVFSHCLTGGRNLTEYYVGARLLAERGIGSYRFDYYGGDAGARSFLDCTVDTHVEDLRLVLLALRSECPDRPLVVVGHSLGGLVALQAGDADLDGLVLWDGSHSESWGGTLTDAHTVEEPDWGFFRMRWGVEVLTTREMLASYRLVDCDELARRFAKPLLAVAAGDGVLVDYQRRYAELTAGTFACVEGADHSFTRGETLTDACRITAGWIRSTFRT